MFFEQKKYNDALKEAKEIQDKIDAGVNVRLKTLEKLAAAEKMAAEKAEAAEKAGIDTMNIRYTPERPEIAKNLREAAPNTFMSFSMPTTAATSESDALKLSYDAMAIGADSILCGTWSLKFINAVSNAGIPTEGHLGLVPRRSTWTGGLRAVGKTINQAKKIYDDLKTLENVASRLGDHSSMTEQ